MQRNWIGRSEGAKVRFPIQGEDASIEVFTTRIDTIFGATFMMLAPEHALVTSFAKESQDEKAFMEKAQRFRSQDRAGRLTGEVEKEGFFTGRFAINPFTNKPIPIWVANYVLGRVRHRRRDGRGGPRRARSRLRHASTTCRSSRSSTTTTC